jgi:hypothetical protein
LPKFETLSTAFHDYCDDDDDDDDDDDEAWEWFETIFLFKRT